MPPLGVKRGWVASAPTLVPGVLLVLVGLGIRAWVTAPSVEETRAAAVAPIAPAVPAVPPIPPMPAPQVPAAPPPPPSRP